MGNPKEKAILVALHGHDGEPSLEELGNLTVTAGGRVAGSYVQRRGRPDPATYIGRGKAEEVGQACRAVSADLVIIDDDLSPAQAANLEKIVGARVIDRSGLILDIFARHARTNRARTQVELAQLEYLLPRLTRMWEHLSRTGGGIGTRGPGETQLEVDRRRVRERIQRLKGSLKQFDRQRETQSRRRRHSYNVALVGYTNAGKSSLLRRFTQRRPEVDSLPFTTLDATTGELVLPYGRRTFLTDTVGFINKLPTQLISSFQSTLQEAVLADLLLLVVDISSPDASEMLELAESVLNRIGAGDNPRLYVLNKVDRCDDRTVLRKFSRRYPQSAAVSAVTGQGLGTLKWLISDILRSREKEVERELPPERFDLVAWLYRQGAVMEKRMNGRNMNLKIRLPEADLRKFDNALANNTFPN